MPARITICYQDRPAVEADLLESGEYRLGRSRECELFLNHPTVSRDHASMRFLANAWQLDDRHSQNGTRVNGVRVDRFELNGDELISVGELDCLFETHTAEQVHAINAHNQWRRQQVSRVSSLDQTISEQLASAVNLTGTERGLILLGQDVESLKVAANIGVADSDYTRQSFVGSLGAIEKALTTEKPVIAMDVSRDDFLAARESIKRKQIAALAAIPLFSQEQLIGVLYTDSQQSTKLLTELDIDILSSLASQIALGSHAAQLQQQVKQLQGWLLGASNETRSTAYSA